MMASEDSTFDALAVNAVNGMPPPVPPKDPPPPHLKDAKGLLQHPSTTTLTNPPGSRRIHPSEISRIACLGDSLLTGLCLEQDSTSARARLLSVLARRVHRGIAWIVSGEHRENTCIAGGADGVLSVGRMVRWYAPEVRGLCERRTRLGSKGSGLNVARSGAFVHDLDAQVQELLRRINCERVPAIPEDGWTLAFIWIGANDVVSRTREQLLATYAPHLLRAIRQLRAGLGTHRLLVCVLTLPDLSHVALEDERLESTTEAAAASVVRETVRLLNLEIEHALARLECDDTDADPERFRVRVVPVPGDEVPRDLYRECFVAVDGSHPNIVAHELFAKTVHDHGADPRTDSPRKYTLEQTHNLLLANPVLPVHSAHYLSSTCSGRLPDVHHLTTLAAAAARLVRRHRRFQNVHCPPLHINAYIDFHNAKDLQLLNLQPATRLDDLSKRDLNLLDAIARSEHAGVRQLFRTATEAARWCARHGNSAPRTPTFTHLMEIEDEGRLYIILPTGESIIDALDELEHVARAVELKAHTAVYGSGSFHWRYGRGPFLESIMNTRRSATISAGVVQPTREAEAVIRSCRFKRAVETLVEVGLGSEAACWNDPTVLNAAVQELTILEAHEALMEPGVVRVLMAREDKREEATSYSGRTRQHAHGFGVGKRVQAIKGGASAALEEFYNTDAYL
ncbi:hypothetical protein HK101_000453 [Irineochytrium annulatum]|nr:hypothetical protein HK101_000453 [Irineochytrium annulatum]